MNEILHGRCEDRLKEVPSNSVDCVASDPPYALGFMGKEWDKALPSLKALRESLRVLKPGAFAFWMCSPRQDLLSRMIGLLEKAGFKTGFTSLYHTFASGFPKSQNIEKAILKKNPNDPRAKELAGSFGGYQPKPSLEKILISAKPYSKKQILTFLTCEVIAVISCITVKPVETNSSVNQILKEYIAPVLAQEKIKEDLIADIGKEGGSKDLMVILKSTLEIMEKEQFTNWNIDLLWNGILIALLWQRNRFTTKMVSGMITELKTLRSYLFQIIPENTTPQNEIRQNGFELNVNLVESILINILVKLKSLNQTSVPMNATSKIKPNYQPEFAKDAKLSSITHPERENTVPLSVITKMGEKNENNELKSSVLLAKQNLKSSLLTSNEAVQSNSTVKENVTSKAIETKVILVTMKPLSEKTFVAQALKNGKGVTWLSNGRIPIVDITKEAGYRPKAKDHKTNVIAGMDSFIKERTGITEKTKDRTEFVADLGHHNSKGRFPANLLIQDDILDTGAIHKVGAGEKINSPGDNTNPSHFTTNIKSGNHYGDSGGFSRFFSLDLWWQARLKHLPEAQQQTFPFLVVSKPSQTERNLGLEGSQKSTRPSGQLWNADSKEWAHPIDTLGETAHSRWDTCATCGKYILQNPARPSKCTCENPIRQHKPAEGNFHPTVKSVSLFCYLISLGSRPGDIILDPYMGSGTTAIAAKILERQWIGVELNETYVKLAKKRIAESRTLESILYKKLPEQKQSGNLFKEFGV